MGPRTTVNGEGREYQLYVCNGRRTGSTDCRRRAVRREVIDGGLEPYLDRAGLTDLEAARARFREQATRDLEHVRALLASARKRSADDSASLDRIRNDYRAGKLTAEEWRGFQTEIEADRDEALAEVERFSAREQELLAEGDDEGDALAYLTELGAALTEPIRNAETLGALRQQLARVFECFVLREPRQLTDTAVGPAPVEVAGLWLQPVIREEAFDSIVASRKRFASRR
jgi:hypothetical protein